MPFSSHSFVRGFCSKIFEPIIKGIKFEVIFESGGVGKELLDMLGNRLERIRRPKNFSEGEIEVPEVGVFSHANRDC